jgi:hypothetical protein
MNKTEYSLQLVRFMNKLTNDTRVAIAETGRKFDRVFFIGGTQKSVRYFIAKRDVDGHPAGSIFGAKSVLAPNMNWYFGTLSTIDKWNWDGYHGEPVNDDTVELAKAYGGYKHYRLKAKP